MTPQSCFPQNRLPPLWVRRRWVPVALLAALTPLAHTAEVRHAPQSGVRIEQGAQRDLQYPALPVTQPRSASPTQGQREEATAAERQDEAQEQARSQSPRKPVAKSRHSSPTTQREAPQAANALQPPWYRELLAQLSADEQGEPAPFLLYLIGEHAPQLHERGDAPLLARIGWALYRLHKFSEAANWFEAALSKKPQESNAREGLFYALQRSGELARAFEVAAPLAHLQSARADVAVQNALNLRPTDPSAAAHWLQQAVALGKNDTGTRELLAWTLLQTGRPEAAAELFTALYHEQPSNRDLAQGLLQSLQQSGQSARLAELAVHGGALADLLRRDEALALRDLGLARDAAQRDATADPALTGAAAPSVALGTFTRSKSGGAGTSQLLLRTTPTLQLRWTNELGAWDLSLQPRVEADSGATPPPLQTGTTLPGVLGSGKRQTALRSATLSWRTLGPSGPYATLGVTPEALFSSTWIGTLGWRDMGQDHDWSAALERSPVDDSLLSLLGLRDAATGRPWGRVLRQGVVLSGYQQIAPSWNLSASARFARLVGEKVADNTHVALSVGLSRDLPLPGMRYFSVGPALSWERYRRNLSGFTWGHGGYFSPQDFTSASLLAVFQTHDARPFVVAGQVQIGWQSVRQDAAECFPLPTPLPAPLCTPLAASRSSGLGSSTSVQWAGLLAPHWAIEGSARWRTGPAYQDRELYLGLRYFLSPRKALFGSDLPPRR